MNYRALFCSALSRALMEMCRTSKQKQRDAIHDFPLFALCMHVGVTRRADDARTWRTRTDGRDNLSDACED